MSEMIAFCGLVCTQCPVFLATQHDDDKDRAETAAMLAEKYGLDLKPEEINCDGCHSTGDRLIGYCLECGIRQCGLEKGIETCASCDAQPCEKLTQFHTFSPEAKTAFSGLLNKD